MERKILHTILGPRKMSENDFERTNKEVEGEIGVDTAVRFLKIQRIKWLGHVWRVSEAVFKAITEYRASGRRKPGRPDLRWHEKMGEDKK